MAPAVNATVVGGLVAAALFIGFGPSLGKRFGRYFTTRGLPTYVLRSETGVSIHISPIGCAITKLLAPDARGRVSDIVLGFDDLTAYLDGRNPYFGVVVGRCANRIADGQFKLDGQTYSLPINDPPNELHGTLLFEP
ncbi:hypothetical protein WJX84_006795 [Apatococcus fuscideae]|uniref:Aldose 1-epimerase n=1 Tax=Apatococcus fuscideae TaxID=2026836 RepID=A0AAW1T284_9CHLO